jgi:hypothetical protein
MGGGGIGGDAQTFIDHFWGAYCKQIMTCTVADNDAIGERLLLGTEARCLEAFREILGEEPPTRDLLAQIEAGTVRFVPEAADACIAEASDCKWGGYFPNGPACRAVFEGTVPVGGACNRWEECAGAAYCDHTDGCPGRCALLGEPGEPCNSRWDCNPGDGYAVCDWDANDTCARLPIGPRAELNEPCTVDPLLVTEFVVCENGLFCDAGDGTSPTGVCRMPIGDGEACDSSNDVCDGNRRCVDQTSCETIVIARSVGDACDSTANVYCDVYSGLTCVAGRCELFGDGTVGSDCRDSDIYQRVTCNDGLYCARDPLDPYMADGTCQTLLDTDAPCEAADECASGACDGTCAPRYCDG